VYDSTLSNSTNALASAHGEAIAGASGRVKKSLDASKKFMEVSRL